MAEPAQYRRVSDAIAFELLWEFKRQSGKFSAQKMADILNAAHGEELTKQLSQELSRESIYPLIQEAIRRFAVLKPPVRVAMAQRLMDYYHLDPGKFHVTVADVLDGPVAADAVAYAGSHIIRDRLQTLAAERRVSLALGSGWTVKVAIRTLGHMLRSELDPPDFVVYSLVPAEISIEEHPFTFARYLETDRNNVLLDLRNGYENGPDIAVFGPDSGGGFARYARHRVLLAGPGTAESLRPWLDSPSCPTDLVVSLGTADDLLEAA